MNQITAEEAVQRLVGRSVVSATDDTLVLSDGVRLIFDRSVSDCCSWLGLRTLRPVPNIITAAYVEDDETNYTISYTSEYRAWIRVVTEAGELNVAEAEGDATSGNYLHGFALGVRIEEDKKR